MCEAVENYAKEYAKECSIRSSANIIKNTIFGEDRDLIIEEISENS